MRAVNIRGKPTDYALKNYRLRMKSEVTKALAACSHKGFSRM